MTVLNRERITFLPIAAFRDQLQDGDIFLLAPFRRQGVNTIQTCELIRPDGDNLYYRRLSDSKTFKLSGLARIMPVLGSHRVISRHIDYVPESFRARPAHPDNVEFLESEVTHEPCLLFPDGNVFSLTSLNLPTYARS